MTSSAANELRSEILRQVSVMQEIMSQIGIHSISNSYLTDDGNAGLGESHFLDAADESMDCAGHEVSGSAFPVVFLLSNGGIHRALQEPVIKLEDAADYLAENITEFFYATSGIDIVNQIDIKITVDELDLRIDVSEADEPLYRDWSLETGAFVDRYIIADDEGSLWGHLFEGDTSESGKQIERTCRFVFDTQTDKLVAAGIMGKNGSDFDPATKDECADLEESLIDANPDALTQPEQWGLRCARELPAWARPEIEDEPTVGM